ncbi:MAG TPA: cation transporter [Clostridiales bacterium]|nr:cation transporter [Clostridiales bacterium]
MHNQAAQDRETVIVRTSIIGIAANVFLAAFKAAVGILSHSIAVTLDAVNNISDAASSIITIIGTKLAGKQPDKKHPYGHGRIEYLTAVLISVIILYAGVSSLAESVKKILHPEAADYSPTALLIISVAVVVKILLGRYVKRTGERVRSDSLIASGSDAMLDSIISASTLAAALIDLTMHISLEAWLGAVISIVIIKSGVDMLRGTLSEILGERVDSSVSGAIKRTVASFSEVSGVYDLVLHSYGPDRLIGSVHVEVPDYFTAAEIDALLRRIQTKVYYEHNVVLAAIGIYSVNTKNETIRKMHQDILGTVLAHPYVLQMHGFYVNEAEKRIQFDVVIDFDSPDRDAEHAAIVDEVQRMYPDYTLIVTLDADVSD